MNVSSSQCCITQGWEEGLLRSSGKCYTSRLVQLHYVCDLNMGEGCRARSRQEQSAEDTKIRPHWTLGCSVGASRTHILESWQASLEQRAGGPRLRLCLNSLVSEEGRIGISPVQRTPHGHGKTSVIKSCSIFRRLPQNVTVTVMRPLCASESLEIEPSIWLNAVR